MILDNCLRLLPHAQPKLCAVPPAVSGLTVTVVVTANGGKPTAFTWLNKTTTGEQNLVQPRTPIPASEQLFPTTRVNSCQAEIPEEGLSAIHASGSAASSVLVTHSTASGHLNPT